MAAESSITVQGSGINFGPIVPDPVPYTLGNYDSYDREMLLLCLRSISANWGQVPHPPDPFLQIKADLNRRHISSLHRRWEEDPLGLRIERHRTINRKGIYAPI